MRRRAPLLMVVALASSGCQVLLGIDGDPEIDAAAPADATTADDAGTSDEDASEAASDAVSSAISDAAADRASDARFNVYIYGKLYDASWQDDSTNATTDYSDESITPRTPPAEIKLTVIRNGGAWGVRAPLTLDTTPYGFVHFSLAPTMANQTWICHVVEPDGGIPARPEIVGHDYADSLPVVGAFTDYTIPLSALDASATTISAFFIQDISPYSTNVWYVDDVFFGN